MLRLLGIASNTAWFCLCACALALGLQSWIASDAHVEPQLMPWVEVTPSLSADGRYVAFEVCRGALQQVPPHAFMRRGGTEARTDIALADMEESTTTIVSRNADGRPSDGSSLSPRLDDSGQHLVFASEASNLVADDNNGMRDVFLYSRESRRLERVRPPGSRIGYASSASPTISADGRRVAFTTYGIKAEEDRMRMRGPVIYDVASGTDLAVNPLPIVARGPCYGAPSLSADGARLAFASLALEEDPAQKVANQLPDIFVCNLGSKRITRVCVPAHGGHPDGSSFTPVLARDACAFCSLASNLVPDDTNHTYDIFVRDLKHKTTERVSVSSTGEQANDASFEPTISRDGRWVAFASYASNLVPGDTNRAMDVFLHDRLSGQTRLVSHRADGRPANAASYNPCISADGRFIAFVSLADDFTPELASRGQVYLWERATDRVRRVPLPSPAEEQR